jgi:hypothetical protein
MKVRTNLSPSELHKVGTGLQVLAKKQQPSEIVLENVVEKHLIAKVDSLFATFAASLNREIMDIMEKED